MTADRTDSLTLIDVQAQRPTVQLSLSRVGVTGVEKVIRLNHGGAEQLFLARFECVVELGPDQKGAHMSRFEEVINEAIDAVVLDESTFKAETLAEHIAQLVRTRQRRAAPRSPSRRASPSTSPPPSSGIETQELYTLHGSAICTELGTRRLIGVTAQGMTACPCAQELVAGEARERLSAGAASTRRDRADPRGRPGRDPQPARPRHAAHRLHRAVRRRDRRGDAARDRRAVDVVGDLRADEALRRGARRREGPPPPAVRRGLRARDDQRRRRALPRRSTTARSSRRAR